MSLSQQQKLFASTLASATGLSPQAIGAWVLAEEPPGPSTTRGDQNWLNIGQFDAGPGKISFDQAFKRDPATAARQTAAFLRGQWGGAAPGIRAILGTAGKSPQAELAAIAASPWASSHYGGAGKLESLLGQVGGISASGGGGNPSVLGQIPMIKPINMAQLEAGQPPNAFDALAGLEQTRQMMRGDTAGTSALGSGWDLLSGIVKGQQAEQQAISQIQSVPSTMGPQPQPMSHGGDVDPLQHFRIGRTDMGVDANASPGTPILAPNDSKVVHIYPNWYNGQPYLLLQLISGPNRGKYYYIAEQINNLARPGTVVRRGQAVARYAPSGTGIEMGWGTPSSRTLAQATSGYSEGAQTSAGKSFRNYLHGLGS